MDLTRRQQEIVSSALGLVAAGGIQRLTIGNLARKLGITEPAIYRHFRDKAAIVATLVDGFDAGASAVLEEVNAGEGSALAGLERFVTSRFESVAANPPLARVLFAEEMFMDDPEISAKILAMMHRHRDGVMRLLERGVASGEVRGDIAGMMLFRLVMGPVRLLIRQWGMSQQAFDLREQGGEMWNALKKMLEGRS